ncbi:MAG: hypothetical protein ACLRSE_09605 [Alistipes finegoldii]
MFAAFLAAMVLIAVAFTGCGKDSDNKGGGGANSVEWDPAKTVHPDQEGAAVLLVTGDTGTPWTAEIISGAEWISFNRTAPGGQTVKTGKVGTEFVRQESVCLLLAEQHQGRAACPDQVRVRRRDARRA